MNSQRNIPIGPAWVFSLAKGWAQTVRYLLIDTAAAGIVTGTYFLSQFFPFNKGVPIATLEVLSSLSVLMFLLVNPKLLNNRALKILFLVFSFLLIGDLFYAYFYYWKEIGTPTRFSILVHEIPLSLSYFLLSVFYLYCMRRSYREIFFHPFCVVPLLVTLPVMARFVFPLTNPVATTMDPLIQGLEIFSLLCTFVGLVLSIVVFTFAKPLFWSVFSLGMTTSYLAGLGIRIDRLSGANVQFNNFESLWAFGNLVAVIAILSFSERGQDITYKKERSIILSARMLGIMVAFASSVILSVTHWKELGVMQTIIFTSLVSVHLAGALAHFLWDRLVEFSAAVEKLFKSDVVASVPHSHNPNGIPIEMAEL